MLCPDILNVGVHTLPTDATADHAAQEVFALPFTLGGVVFLQGSLSTVPQVSRDNGRNNPIRQSHPFLFGPNDHPLILVEVCSLPFLRGCGPASTPDHAIALIRRVLDHLLDGEHEASPSTAPDI
jgi:hypothetical protein